MASRQGSSAQKAALAEARQYSDIERWTTAYPSQCDGCNRAPQFVLKDAQGHTLMQCANCLTETLRKDPEMAGRILRAVAERI